ncbi:hypothetical protein CMI47_04255 [Candidatus Pacearchaeota archaeon]|jgi:phage terminase large subunit GpA-like protein|nr:hypothetical protein [Candidatus Pacearchaeota archaeon]|tara:strand:+ start:3005 stop:5113 length:2109 start_codon:yes stop_codon:yes gene_type:complete
MALATPIWSPADKAAWAAPQDILPSEWCDRFWRQLGESVLREQYSTTLTPYSREPMDMAAERRVRRMVLQWAAQVGKTAIYIGVQGWKSDVAPGPQLHVIDSEDHCKDFFDRRVKPLFRIARLRRHATGAVRDHQGCSIRLANDERNGLGYVWATPGKLSERPIELLVIDEVDKIRWNPNSEEAHPVDLADERVKNFPHTSLVILVCTPTTEDGRIHIEYVGGDQRRYHVPCPQCGLLQLIERQRVIAPKDASHQAIIENNLARHVCADEQCAHPMNERERRRMLEFGIWIPQAHDLRNQHVDFRDVEEHIADHLPATRNRLAEIDREIVGTDGDALLEGDMTRLRQYAVENLNRGECPPQMNISYQIGTQYSTIVPLGRFAVKYRQSRNKQDQRKHFKNSWEGEPFSPAIRSAESKDVRERCQGTHEKWQVPDEALGLTGGVDVQKGYLRLMVVAWGYEGRIWIVGIDRVETWEELEQRLFVKRYHSVDGTANYVITYTFIDCAYDPNAVFEFTDTFPEQAGNIYGKRDAAQQSGGSDLFPRNAERDQQGQNIIGGRQKWVWGKFKYIGQALGLLTPENAGHARLQVYQDIEEDYLDELTAWHFTRRQQSAKSSIVIQQYEPKKAGIADHSLFTLCYNLCAGTYLDCEYEMPEPTQQELEVETARSMRAVESARREDYSDWGGMVDTSDWGGGGGGWKMEE